MENFNEVENAPSQLVVTESIKINLNEISKWAKFLAIIGFIGMGILLIVSLIVMTTLGTLGIIYIILDIVYFFPVYYLFKFASEIQSAFYGNNQYNLDLGIEYLKSHYKFIGIITIVTLAIYLVIIFVGILALHTIR